MEHERFDEVIRRLGAGTTRRGALGLLAGLAGLVVSALPAPAARRKRGKGKTGRGKTRAKGKAKAKTRAAKQRQPDAQTEAADCCKSGNCTPGKGKNLAKCCYEGQDLTGKNFSGANLDTANLSGATLTKANLQGANAGKACFVDAILSNAKINNSTNLSGAIFCRTTMPDGSVNDSGCSKGTACCSTCDGEHPCDDGEACCNGRCIPGDCCDNGEQSTCGAGNICCGNVCVAGDCCAIADCPNETCQRRRCQDHQCIYTPISGDTGPGCQTVCCENADKEPVCCDAGVTVCTASGRCHCASQEDCGSDEVCCDGQCVRGVCCQTQDCAPRTCQTRSCQDHECAYEPVVGEEGPDCDTICCQDEQEEPTCCPAGTTICTASGLCGCQGNQDCGASDICCNGTCIADTQCCDNDPRTCPAPGICQQRACSTGACQPQGLTGGPCPFASGGTGQCSNGACICPSPRITCSDGCCAAGVTACKADGTCSPSCDVCPSGCPFTTLAAAVAGTPANGTIRICPGTYPTNSVTISQKNLTIVGAGSGSDPATATILSGGNTSWILFIVAAAVTIQDLTVTEGKATDTFDGIAGGISVAFGATLTLERVEIVGNTAITQPDSGGNTGGGLTVFSGSTVVVKASRIEKNSLPRGGGGGIFNGGTLTLETTHVELNSAQGGGGVFNAGKLTLNAGAVVTMNTATNPTPSGGGIYNIGTIIDADPMQPNVFGNSPDNCISESPGTGCPA